MTRARVILLVLIPLAAGLATYGLRSDWVISERGSPALECIGLLELGEQQRGRTITREFKIANRGDGDLHLSRFSSTCGCLGVFQEVDGRWNLVETMNLSPGQEQLVTARFAIRGQAGQSTTDYIRFVCNDPERSTHEVAFHVSNVRGGIIATPGEVVFGRALVGSQAQRIIRVLDDHSPPRKIRSARSSHPDRFKVRILPSEKGASETSSKAVEIARLEVEMFTQEPIDVVGEIEVQLEADGLSPDSIPVTGFVVHSVTVTPLTIILPRRSRSGKIYSAECICRAAEGREFSFEILEVPERLRVTPDVAREGAYSVRLRIEWDRAKDDIVPGEKVRRVVRCRARLNGEDCPLEIIVLCRAEEVTP